MRKFTESDFCTKQAAQQALLDVLDPLKPFYGESCARLYVGVTSTHYENDTIPMEAFARPLWGLVPFWAGGGRDERFEEIYRKGLAAGTDPEHPDYWHTCRDYDQKFCDYKGFRYAELVLSPGVRVTRVEAEVRHYPMDETRCTLSTDNPALDGIFRICKNGVKYGTQEAYLDCPTREKGQYLGDAVISAHAHVWLTGDVQMLRKCIAQFAHTAGICPGLMAVAPGAYMQEVADFSLLWSQLLLLDYQFTGDREFLKKYLPTAEGIIRHFRRYEREDGLLEQVADKWNLVDWPENLRDGYDFKLSRPVVAPGCHNVVNALYVGAVKTFEELMDILEDPIDIPEASADDLEERENRYRRETGCGEKKRRGHTGGNSSGMPI